MRISLKLAFFLSGFMLSNLWHIAAQSDAILSQYFYTPVYYNAGAAGNGDAFNISAAGQIHDGSNKYAHVSADMPFSLGDRYRIGGGVIAEYAHTAITRDLSFSLPLAWKFSSGDKELSLGIAPGITSSRIKESQSIIDDDKEGEDSQANTETSSSTEKRNKTTRFNFGGGVWYNSKSFRAGLSFTHYGDKKQKEFADTMAHGGGTAYYFMAAGNIPVKSSLLDIEPSIVATLWSGKLYGQATARAIWKRCLWIGAGYRLHESAVAMAGIEFKGFKAGYSFLLPHKSDGYDRKGGHEVVAAYSLPLDLTAKKKPRHKSVRLM